MRNNQGKNEMLKRLKEEKAGTIEAVKDRVKAQRIVVSLIKNALRNRDLTVPEISRDTGLGSPEVLWYLSTLKAYGEIEESGKEGNYYRYRLTAQPAERLSPHSV